MCSAEKNRVFNYFYIARQPIFDNSGRIWGYELLFRSGQDKQTADIVNEDLATLSVATCGFLQSQEYSDLTKRICINFTEKLLLDGAPRALPPSVAVIEIPETINPTKALIKTLIELKQEGYIIAIDNYVGQCDHRKLLDIADIIKINIFEKTAQQVEALYHGVSSNNSLIIAEKVDNRDAFHHLRSLGCDLYQGFFFAKPVNMRGRQLRSAEISKVRILQAIEDANAGAEAIKNVIEADPSVTYRLLRLLNSAAFGLTVKIASVKHAIGLIGIKRLKHWLRMIVMSDLSKGAHAHELFIMGLNRGRFLEDLTQQGQIATADPETMFLFGILSLIEPMLEIPMKDIVTHLPLANDIKAGYTNSDSTYGQYLQLAVAIENMDSKAIETLCRQLNLDDKKVADASRRAIAWANSMYQSMT